MLQMEKDNNIKSLLGLSQEEAAMLLGITRMQWAQFITGRRDIPVAAKLKLAEVLSTIQKNKTNPQEVNKLIETEKKIAQEGLHQELKAIKLKELQLERKIKKTDEVRKEAFSALQVVAYLESKKENSLAKFIKTRAKNTLNKHSLQHLQELQLKKESLEMLKLQIEEKLKCKKNIDFQTNRKFIN